jgi:DinB superfamily
MCDCVDFSQVASDSAAASRVRSGRPLDGEFADYAKPDIDGISGDDAIGALALQALDTMALLRPLRESDVSGVSYAAGKWTVKEVIGHLADDERIFAYRALCIARNDLRPLAGFDEKRYVEAADFESRPLPRLVAEYCAVRRATISLLEGLSPAAWMRRGLVNEYSATVRGLAFHIVGHERRHVHGLGEKYGLRR